MQNVHFYHISHLSYILSLFPGILCNLQQLLLNREASPLKSVEPGLQAKFIDYKADAWKSQKILHTVLYNKVCFKQYIIALFKSYSTLIINRAILLL